MNCRAGREIVGMAGVLKWISGSTLTLRLANPIFAYWLLLAKGRVRVYR